MVGLQDCDKNLPQPKTFPWCLLCSLNSLPRTKPFIPQSYVSLQVLLVGKNIWQIQTVLKCLLQGFFLIVPFDRNSKEALEGQDRHREASKEFRMES